MRICPDDELSEIAKEGYAVKEINAIGKVNLDE